ncbi:MAG: aminotransferase class I/II-fold pyridoxal phosphate-dependent enzyme [Pygmaiobacter massiliensis]|nr:aminotransferase class I/II-fold pyridoxal phosphate-dependent enzyme [Pygmaiobacter massiliensis]
MNFEYSENTNLLHSERTISGMSLIPETFPLFATAAFSQKNMTDVRQAYAEKQFTYVRTRNPNRRVLADAISLLEGSEDSFIASSGMGAIFSTLFALLKAGDHVLCNKSIYGETYEIMTQVLPFYQIEADLVDFSDLNQVRAHMRKNTRVVYTEVASNPCIQLVDLKALAEIAHQAGAFLVVDNTFTTPVNIKPLAFGADVSINSLTKFLNGHSDALGGSASGCRQLVEKISFIGKVSGTPISPYDSWMIFRGLQTAVLRIEKQTENAVRLAAALAQNPHVEAVFHPSVAQNSEKQLAMQLFGQKGGSPMLSFIVPENDQKFDLFLEKLSLSHYAMTLGGLRTTLSHPCTSSHHSVPDAERRALGITPGMFRVSVGLEDAEDLIDDFNRALTVFD